MTVTPRRWILVCLCALAAFAPRISSQGAPTLLRAPYLQRALPHELTIV